MRYRRRPRREDLLLATLARHWRQLDVPDTGSLRQDALAFLRTVNAEQARTLILMRIQLAEVPRSERVVNPPFDLVRHDMLMSMDAVPDETIIEIVDTVWLPLLGLPPHGAQTER